MQHTVERYCDLHPRHDSESGWTELRCQFLDTEPKSGNEQWRGGQWSTLDCDGRMFNLLNQAVYSDWIGGLRNDKFQHKSELDGSRPSRRVHCQLQRTAERGFDCNPNHHIRYCDWPFTFDKL